MGPSGKRGNGNTEMVKKRDCERVLTEHLARGPMAKKMVKAARRPDSGDVRRGFLSPFHRNTDTNGFVFACSKHLEIQALDNN